MTILEQRQSESSTVENFPAIVVIDSEGNNLYETAIKEYRKVEE